MGNWEDYGMLRSVKENIKFAVHAVGSYKNKKTPNEARGSTADAIIGWFTLLISRSSSGSSTSTRMPSCGGACTYLLICGSNISIW